VVTVQHLESDRGTKEVQIDQNPSVNLPDFGKMPESIGYKFKLRHMPNVTGHKFIHSVTEDCSKYWKLQQ